MKAQLSGKPDLASLPKRVRFAVRTPDGDRLPEKIWFVADKAYWSEIEKTFDKSKFYSVELTFRLEQGPKGMHWHAVVTKVENLPDANAE